MPTRLSIRPGEPLTNLRRWGEIMRNLLIVTGLLVSTASLAAHPEGEYVARVSDCIACHTAAGGAPMAGGKAFPTPLGDIYATNITPDKTHGIGSYSYADFEKALRQGIAKDGHPLYPAMPYPSYAKLSDPDLRALYDYMMQDVPPSATANRESDIPWLLSARWPLHIWNAFFTDSPQTASTNASDALKRGAYLVSGPGHCGACHTPRGFAMQEKAYDDSDTAFLSGETIDGWYAPSLRGLDLSAEELASLLLIGRSKHAAISGSMSEVVTQSTQYLTKPDADAIAQYLLSLKADAPTRQTKANPHAGQSDAGKTVYLRYCSTCHGAQGKGTDDNVPSLVNNRMVQAEDPSSLIRVIVEGAETPTTWGNVSYKMPAYRGTLNDQQIRDVTNYVRGAWGNNAPPADAGAVSTVNKRETRHEGGAVATQ